MCVGLSGPVKFFVYRFYVCGALRAGKLVCVGWLSSLRRFLALLAVVSTSFPCLVILLLFTRGTSLLLAAFRVLLCYCSPWERVVVASRQYFSYRSSYVGSSQVFYRDDGVCRLRIALFDAQ